MTTQRQKDALVSLQAKIATQRRRVEKLMVEGGDQEVRDEAVRQLLELEVKAAKLSGRASEAARSGGRATMEGPPRKANRS